MSVARLPGEVYRPDRVNNGAVPTWKLFVAAATPKVVTAWLYDTKFIPVMMARTQMKSATLPPLFRALLSQSHDRLLVMHTLALLVLFGVSVVFVACCLQLVLLALRWEIPLRDLIRATLVASTALTVGAVLQTIALVAYGDSFVRALALGQLGSLASVLPRDWTVGPNIRFFTNAFTVFEIGWCVLLTMYLARQIPSRVAAASVGIVWAATTVCGWALVVLLPKVIT